MKNPFRWLDENCIQTESELRFFGSAAAAAVLVVAAIYGPALIVKAVF